MVSQAITNDRITALCDEPPYTAETEVVQLHITRRQVLNAECWPHTDLILLPMSRKVRLKSNPGILATCRVRAYREGDRLYVRADAEDAEWIGPVGESFEFALPAQLEAEALVLAGL